MREPVEDLRRDIARGDVLVIAGAGVALAGSGGARVAGWRGLLEDGIERCVSVRGVSQQWADAQHAQLGLDNVGSWISVAKQVSDELQAGGELRTWLLETVGALETSHEGRGLLDAVIKLGAVTATTNYDGLLEQVSGRPPVTWREEGSIAQRVLRGDTPGIVHLHGYWEEASSIVLGDRSYTDILNHAQAQAMQRALASTRTLVLIGFGAGLQDPNFSELRQWMASTWSQSEYRHYLLLRDSEVETARREHEGEGILPIGFGARHEDLEPFLRGLAPAGSRQLAISGLAAAIGTVAVSVVGAAAEAGFERDGRRESSATLSSPGGVVGVGGEAELRLVGPGFELVSRSHLVLAPVGPQWTVTDVSTNGSQEQTENGRWVDLPRDRAVPVEDGMLVRICDGVVLQLAVRRTVLSGAATPLADRADEQRLRPAELEELAIALLNPRHELTNASLVDALGTGRKEVKDRLKALRKHEAIQPLIKDKELPALADAIRLAFPYLVSHAPSGR